MAQQRKVLVYVEINNKRFRCEIFEEPKGDTPVIDLTQPEQRPSISKRRPAAEGLRLNIPKPSNNLHDTTIDLTTPSPREIEQFAIVSPYFQHLKSPAPTTSVCINTPVGCNCPRHIYFENE